MILIKVEWDKDLTTQIFIYPIFKILLDNGGRQWNQWIERCIRLSVLNAIQNAKFRSSQQKAKEFCAPIASEEAGQEEISTTEISEATGQEKCTRQLALIVAKNVKFLSSQLKEELFYAMIALGQRKEVANKQTSNN